MPTDMYQLEAERRKITIESIESVNDIQPNSTNDTANSGKARRGSFKKYACWMGCRSEGFGRKRDIWSWRRDNLIA